MGGEIELILGGMRGGKTTELIVRLNKYSVRSQVQTYSPVIDIRTKRKELKTADGLARACQKVMSSQGILDTINDKTSVVGIDEVQMFDENILYVIDELKNQERIVVVAGLMLDFRGNYFPFRKIGDITRDSDKNMSDLIKMVTNYITRPSLCTHSNNGSICGTETFHTQRYLTDGITIAGLDDPTIIIGTSEIENQRINFERQYAPRCRDHFITPT